MSECHARTAAAEDEALLVADFFVHHQLAINEVYCALKRASNLGSGISPWPLAFLPSAAPSGLRLIPDGYVRTRHAESGDCRAFLEVDLGHERLTVWKEKIRNYLTVRGLRRLRATVRAEAIPRSGRREFRTEA